MIGFSHVHKFYDTPSGRKTLLRDFSMEVPSGAKVALMGRNGAGKSTMIGLLSGTVSPNGGRIRRTGTMSWPMGFSGSFAADITGRQNALFVARIYGVDARALIAFVEEFAELREFFDMPVRSYSSGMRARLAFGLSMGLGFDWYLVDEVTAVGDTAFRKKSLETFRTRLKDAGLIMVSHSTATLRDYCSCGIVLEGGEAQFFPDLEEAIRQHEMNMDSAFAEVTLPVDDEEGTDGEAAEAIWREARRRFQNRDYARAEELLVRAIDARPGEGSWHALLGDIQRRMGVVAPAIESYRRALALENEPRHRVALAGLLASAGHEAEAEAEFQAVLSLDPNNYAANYALGRLRYRQGDLATAQRMLELVVAADRDNPGAHRVLAQLHETQGDHARALVHHTHVARLLPDNADFLAGYARSQTRNGDEAGAAATQARIRALKAGSSVGRRDKEHET